MSAEFNIERAIVDAVKARIAEVTAEEIAKAQTEIGRRVTAEVATIALVVARNYSFDRMGDTLLIKVTDKRVAP